MIVVTLLLAAAVVFFLFALYVGGFRHLRRGGMLLSFLTILALSAGVILAWFPPSDLRWISFLVLAALLALLLLAFFMPTRHPQGTRRPNLVPEGGRSSDILLLVWRWFFLVLACSLLLAILVGLLF